MDILVIANSSMGLVKFRKELIAELNKNHNVHIATKLDECEQELRELRTSIHELRMERRGTSLCAELNLFLQIQKIVRKVRPQLIITYTIKPNIYGGMVARINKIPYAVNVTGLGTTFQNEGLFKRMIIQLYRIALKRAKAVFFENQENKQVLIRNRIIRDEQGIVLNGAGVNLETFSCKPYPGENNSNFLFMGRVMKEKGVDELFQAAEKLHMIYPDVKLTILGGYEEDYEEKVKELVQKKIVAYEGWVKDVRKYVEDSICTVLPSYHEGMSNTLLESASMGRPLITSNIPGCREAVRDGVSGLLVQVKDANDLYEKMKQFYELPYEKKKEMSMQARKYMEKEFDKKQVIRTTLDRIGIL